MSFAPDGAAPWAPAGDGHARGTYAVEDPGDQLEPMVPSAAVRDHGPGRLDATAADDMALERRDIRERRHTMLDAALAQGTIGLVDHLIGSMTQPWGYDADDAQAPCLLQARRQRSGRGKHAWTLVAKATAGCAS